ncbi:MAG: Zn-ribbon domain-containing OB-fold protein [Candidimonas sp.]|nr:MAG: Zn-ribbon domain-containing OB-fold protein [Candidimonas sp.]
MTTTRPIPVPTPETQPFWKAARDGYLLLQRCASCKRFVFYPRLVCPHCLGEELAWTRCSGHATVYSFTRVERAPAAFKQEAPYVVALVDLAEGVRMLTRIKTETPEAVHIGMRVRAEFEPVSDTLSLPVFVPVIGSNAKSRAGI